MGGVDRGGDVARDGLDVDLVGEREAERRRERIAVTVDRTVTLRARSVMEDR
jgi:hypothetical protein